MFTLLTMKDFTDYLQNVFMKDRGYMFLDDDLPDQFDEWLVELQAEDFIKYADEYTEIRLMEEAV